MSEYERLKAQQEAILADQWRKDPRTLALRNILALALREWRRGGENWDHVIRFCEDAGAEPTILRAEDFPIGPEPEPSSNLGCVASPTIKLSPDTEHPTCAYLSDGRKIVIKRDGKAAWLAVEEQATVYVAKPAEVVE